MGIIIVHKAFKINGCLLQLPWSKVCTPRHRLQLLPSYVTCCVLKWAGNGNTEGWKGVLLVWLQFDQCENSAFLGHHVGDANAFSDHTKLLPLPAHGCGVFLGEPESDTAKKISRQLSPS